MNLGFIFDLDKKLFNDKKEMVFLSVDNYTERPKTLLRKSKPNITSKLHSMDQKNILKNHKASLSKEYDANKFEKNGFRT